jgi:predicted DNA-binding transcriptional regulator YafY
MDTYKVDRQVLKPDEVLSIVAALKGVNSTLDDRRLQHIEEKMKTLIPQGAKGLWDERIVIDFSSWGNNALIKEKVSLFRMAMEEDRIVHFFYTNVQGVAQERTVEPEKLILKGYMWYLYGYCRIRQDHRLFRLSRMRELRVGSETFVLRPMPVGEYLQGRQNSEVRFIHLVLRFSPRVRGRVEDFFEAEQVEVQEDGSLLVRVSYPEDEWVYGTVLSYGCDVEVLEPAHLREILCARALRMLELYGRAGI